MSFIQNMMRAIIVGAVGSVVASTAHAAPTGLLYVDDIVGQVGTVNLGNGVVSVLGNTGQALTDIAFQDGTLYGVSFDALYSINASTAAATLIAPFGPAVGGVNALTGTTAGVLLAASNANSNLYAVTKAGVVSALSGNTGSTSSGDLAVANGFVYESQIGATGNQLAQLTVSGGSFTSTEIGAFTSAGQPVSRVYGLARASDGTVYAVSGTDIYSVNLTNAALTLVEDYSGHGLDVAFGTAFRGEDVPEPLSLALFGTALAGLGLTRFRPRSNLSFPAAKQRLSGAPLPGA